MATARQFPGVYTEVIDKSSAPPVTSRFRGALVGVATKGLFNTPTAIKSVREYQKVFGASEITNSAGTWIGYLPLVTAFVGDHSDGSVILRVGHQYSTVGAASMPVSGLDGTNTCRVQNASLVSIGDYIKINQPGKESTVNLQVTNKVGNDSAAVLTLSGPLQDTYDVGDLKTLATLYRSSNANAASQAEAFLYAYEYMTNEVGWYDDATSTGTKSTFEVEVDNDFSPVNPSAVSSSGTTVTLTLSGGVTTTVAVGDRIKVSNVYQADKATVAQYMNGEFIVTNVSHGASTTIQYTIESNIGTTTPTNLSATQRVTMEMLYRGELVDIRQAGKVTTSEIMVKDVVNNPAGGCTIKFYTSDVGGAGYQALALQDTYTAATIHKVAKTSGVNNKIRVLHLLARTAGTWANSDSLKTGLIVNVAPGTDAGTKQILIYENGELVEGIDNLSVDPTSDRYYATVINDSDNIRVLPDFNGDFSMISNVAPANTLNGWSTSPYGGSVNQAAFGYGGNASGYNGEALDPEDWIGELDSETDMFTGIQAFKNNQNFDVNAIAAPGQTDHLVIQELTTTATFMNALAVLDVDNIKPRDMKDWRNGQGLYSSRSQIDNWHGAAYGNWITVKDPFTGTSRVVPASVGVMRCMARTFTNGRPWDAIAGEIRGYVDVATALAYETITDAAKESTFQGQVNLLVNLSGRRVIYGGRTLLLDTTSKLSLVNVANLVNYIVLNAGRRLRKYNFDPLDDTLLSEIDVDLTGFMETVKRERGIEDFRVVVDYTNNSANVRNENEVVVDLSIIPTGIAERIRLNISVFRSGVTLLNSAVTES